MADNLHMGPQELFQVARFLMRSSHMYSLHLVNHYPYLHRYLPDNMTQCPHQDQLFVTPLTS